MRLFSKKKKNAEPTYLFYKEIEYKGYKICLHANKFNTDYIVGDFLFLFETGWFVTGLHGQYSTGIAPENLNTQLLTHLNRAKEYIDNTINLPNVIESALNAAKNISIT